MRMRQRGWRLCYVPDAVVMHHRGASRMSNQASTKLVQYHWGGFFRLYRKYWGLRVLWLLKILWYARRPLLLLARLGKRALQV